MENKKWYENAYMLNRDCDWDYYLDVSSREACEASLRQIFGVYKHQLTDVLFNIFCQGSFVPSKTFRWTALEAIELTETEPDRAKRWSKIYKACTEYGFDITQIFIEETLKNGRRPWVSFRMNDCHPCKPSGGIMKQETEAGHTLGKDYGYYAVCYDFAYPGYKNALRDYIEEIITDYDFFGVEFDFLREPYCFDYKNNPECYKIMTEYMRELKAVVTKAEAKHGHKIQILMRVPRDVRTCLEYGFDMVTIAKEGLIDVVGPCARWANTDSGISYKEWKDAVGEDVVVIPGIEYLLPNMTCPTEEHIKGYYAAFRGQGAPAAYIYNIMWDCEEHYPIWNITYESALKGRRQFIVGEQDIAAYYPINAYKPLPMIFKQRTADISLQVGLIKPEDNVTVLIDFEGDEIPTATMLGKRDVVGNVTEPYCLISPSDWEKPIAVTTHTPVAYDFSGVSTEGPLTLSFTGTGKVNWINVIIDAK